MTSEHIPEKDQISEEINGILSRKDGESLPPLFQEGDNDHSVRAQMGQYPSASDIVRRQYE